MGVVEEAIDTVAALPTPIGAQKDVLALAARGHAVVLGTAGSGKTTMAVLRALHLADKDCNHFGKTLLVTYNKSLLAYLEHMLPVGVYDLEVRNYHRFARGYLNHRGKMSGNCILGPGRKRALVLAALEATRAMREDSILEKPDEFFLSELAWISHNGYKDRATYLKANRAGRGVALSEAARSTVFDVREIYLKLREKEGKTYDWDDLASEVVSELETDDEERLFRHVVIDEGQDFSPEMLRSLALAIPDNGCLTFFGDVAQQIYGRNVSWRAAGLNVPKVWEFTKNYRNSPQIAKLALAIADMPYYAEQADMVEPDEFADAGPPPTVVNCDDRKAEDSFVIEQAKTLGRVGTVGILCRRGSDAKRIARGLKGAQHLYPEMPAWRPEGISIGNVHSAKGYEFQSVILVGLSAKEWPDPMAIQADGEEEATALDGRLLYVGVSRARQNLIITTTSGLTDLMPENDDLWLEH
ncbi:MAG TPA: 3'-5' exonuclease [Solirubrobacterales bacterium]|nr:3'-5' exonuclease [Solirubrobacterales bacterium]